MNIPLHCIEILMSHHYSYSWSMTSYSVHFLKFWLQQIKKSNHHASLPVPFVGGSSKVI